LENPSSALYHTANSNHHYSGLMFHPGQTQRFSSLKPIKQNKNHTNFYLNTLKVQPFYPSILPYLVTPNLYRTLGPNSFAHRIPALNPRNNHQVLPGHNSIFSVLTCNRFHFNQVIDSYLLVVFFYLASF